MPAHLDPELQRLVDVGGVESLPVEVEFDELPSLEELAAIGLAGSGKTARGSVSASRVLALSQHPRVRSIRLVGQPQGKRPGTAEEKISSPLREALRDTSREWFHVVVTFIKPPEPGEYPYLAVTRDMGAGRVGREAVWDLAGDENVLRVEIEPDYETCVSGE